MNQSNQGSFKLFQWLGVTVYMHWTWFLLLLIEFQLMERYNNPVWGFLELVGIFAIVTMHEFGHALACKSVGGVADRIVLWPLGGIAFVQPPPRPGAVLWSIAAGPLVNVALLVPTIALVAWVVPLEQIGQASMTDVQRFVLSMAVINAMLLLFNLLPVYPLDGGQILQSLLWFKLGRGRSLVIASSIGLVVAIVAGIASLVFMWIWFVVLAAFIGMQAYQGMRIGRYLMEMERHGPMDPWDNWPQQ